MKKILPLILASLCACASSAIENDKALHDPNTYKEYCQMQLRWARALLEDVDLSSSEHILDIGSGDGQITAEMAKTYPHAHITGLDIAQEMIDSANKSYAEKPNLSFLVGDAHRLPCEDKEKFDAISSFSTFHRLAKPRLALAEVFEALRPGGKFIAAFPASGSPLVSEAIATIDSKPQWKPYFPVPDRKNYSLTDDEFKRWLIKAGFVVVKSRTKWEEEIFPSRKYFRNLLIATSSNTLPIGEKIAFFEEIVTQYLTKMPLDEKGRVHFYFNRIEVVAIKPIASKL